MNTSASGRKSAGMTREGLDVAWPRLSLFAWPEPARPRRMGTGAATTASSFLRSWNSRSLSKSSICIRNASHNWTTHARRRILDARLLEGSSALLRRRAVLSGAPVGRSGLREPIDRNLKSPLKGPSDPASVVHFVRQLDHLDPSASWPHHPDGEDHEGSETHHVVCGHQSSPRIHPD